MEGEATWKAAIVASSKGFWKVEPEPLRVTDEEPDLLLLPQAASTVAMAIGTTSEHARFRVAFKGDLLQERRRSLVKRTA
jgi:hypothetical protein